MGSSSERADFLWLPAVAMSLGWAFRGFIGGGPLGAMIPGAMVALLLCWLLRLPAAQCGLIAAFGAVGVGFGGQMTYGQTVGLASDLDTVGWGLLGLALKGAAWGLLGGIVLAMALTMAHYSRARMASGLLLLVAGTWAGWFFVNAPKRIYFSNLLDRPREEMWAGMFLGALLLMACFVGTPAFNALKRFAVLGFVGGFFGFGLGGVVISAGRNSGLDPQFWPWWKGMEYTFGLLFGLALGAAVWAVRQTLRPRTAAIPGAPRGFALLLASAALVAFSVWFEYTVDLRFNYTVIGAALLFVALESEALAWHIAVTMTCFAFAVDLAEAYESLGLGALWHGMVFAVLFTAAVALLLERWRAGGGDCLARNAFVLVTGAAMLVTTIKTAMQVMADGRVPVEYPLFVGMAVLLVALIRRGRLVSQRKTSGGTASGSSGSLFL